MENKNQYAPLLKEWNLIGSKGDTAAELTETARAFAELIQNGEAMYPSFVTHLRGDVYGHVKFPDSVNVVTSPVVCIERVARELDPHLLSEVNPDEMAEMRRALMSATTGSGSVYYFYIDEASDEMRQLLQALEVPIEFITGNGYHPFPAEGSVSESETTPEGEMPSKDTGVIPTPFVADTSGSMA